MISSCKGVVVGSLSWPGLVTRGASYLLVGHGVHLRHGGGGDVSVDVVCWMVLSRLAGVAGRVQRESVGMWRV